MPIPNLVQYYTKLQIVLGGLEFCESLTIVIVYDLMDFVCPESLQSFNSDLIRKFPARKNQNF